ncbi:transcription initiation factor TFIID subunit 9 [Gouania willdenowi]|uniref:Transcription initiation factor TFIID subunit 9-like n=1 Tax=Gouania willdenowi TaxID=441366 RepID=A0A8C5G794_GOUWI|nr:transcription initiation factor TFIID subunit 9-like [Gouania willdenowi]
MSAPKTIPKDAQVMIQILKDMGITEYEPRVVNQMLEFTYRYVTTIIEDAKIYASHAKKSNVDADDVKLAIQCRMDQSFTSPPPRDFLLDVARQKNQMPLPLIKPYSGPRLPPDRYCLTAPNYRLKSVQKKVTPSTNRISVPRLSVGGVSSRPATPTLGAPSVQTVTKVTAPVSLTNQRFTVQIPPASQTSTTKPTTASTPAVSNVLINPSLIGSKNILITTSMVSQGDSLKRKHEDDDDYDNL